jgi:CBS domain-containing protein
VAGFEFLQMLRLQVQLGGRPAAGPDTGKPSDGDANPNAIDTRKLNDIDRRMLKEAMRMARILQQRMQLDYSR